MIRKIRPAPRASQNSRLISLIAAAIYNETGVARKTNAAHCCRRNDLQTGL